MRIWTIVLLGAAGAVHGADSGSSTEAFGWLKKMANASRQQNYSGTIVYQYGNQVETSRVVHFVNSAGGEFETSKRSTVHRAKSCAATSR